MGLRASPGINDAPGAPTSPTASQLADRCSQESNPAMNRSRIGERGRSPSLRRPDSRGHNLVKTVTK